MKVTLVLGGLSVAVVQSQTTPSAIVQASSSSFQRGVSTSTASASAPRNVNATTAAPIRSSTLATVPSPKPTAYVNPWAGNFSSPISQHGSGSAYALQCQNAWFSYTSINSDFMTVSQSLYSRTEVIRSTTVYEVHTSYETSYYTLCDGHPRVITSTPTATVTTTLPPFTTTYLNMGLGVEAYPNPNCTVNWDDCSGLWSRYSSASSVYNSISFAKANTIVSLGPGASYWVVNGQTTKFPNPSPWAISLGTEQIQRYTKPGQYLILTDPPPGQLFCMCGHTMTAGGPPVTIAHTIDFTQTPYTPSCRTEQPTCTAGSKCKISGDRVEIFWFPPQGNATRDMCATSPVGPVLTRPPTNFTWTPISTGPYTVLPGNTTWFSGNVYVSLNRINARCDWSGTPVEVGKTQHGSILTMAPSELYSLRATPSASGFIDWGPGAYSFNLNDLVSPYPWSAWAGQERCVVDRCSTMNGPYNPRIAVPEAIRRLDPSWASCDLDLNGLYDPPIALSTVGNMFATTTTPPVLGPTATPGQSLPQANAPTNTPIPPGAPVSWQSDPASQPSASPETPGQVPDTVPQPGRPQAPADPSKPNQPSPGSGSPDNTNQPRPSLAPVPAAPGPTTIGSIGTTPIVVNPANPTQISVGTNILTPGGPGLTLGQGTTVSMQDPGHIVISTPGAAAAPSTINVPQPIGASVPTPTAGVIITMPNGERVTATAVLGEGHDGEKTATSVLVSGTMFSVGGAPVTLANGVVLSQAPSGAGVVVVDLRNGGSSTLAFSSVPGIYTPGAATPAPTALVMIGGRVYTATSQGGAVVVPELSLTLTQGGAAATINGTVVSDGGSRTGVVVGSSTAKFPSASATPTGSSRDPSKGAASRVLGEKGWVTCLWKMAASLSAVMLIL